MRAPPTSAPVDDPPPDRGEGGDAALPYLSTLGEVEVLGRERMSHMVYEYVASGAADEATVRWNREAYDEIELCPRVLSGAGTVDTSIRLLGHTLPSPILLAPAAYQRIIHPRGEVGMVQGAAQTLSVVSTGSNTAIEEIAAAATGPLWFQLYLQSDREVTAELVRRVESAGCSALVLTVDTPVIGARDRQRRSGFRLPADAPTPHLHDLNSGRRTILTPTRVPVLWGDVEWLRAFARVPVLLKGILTGEDAECAVECGVAGIIVSNHGGRNLDTLPATLTALPEVAERIAGRLPLLVDGGIRRGSDVVKALASGASAVLIGRPYLYGLAAGGAEGVRRVIEILSGELELAMALCGCHTIREIDASVLRMRRVRPSAGS